MKTSLRKPEPTSMGLEEWGEGMAVSVQEEETEGPDSPTSGPQGFFLPRSKLMMQCGDKTRQSFHKNCLTSPKYPAPSLALVTILGERQGKELAILTASAGQQ